MSTNIWNEGDGDVADDDVEVRGDAGGGDVADDVEVTFNFHPVA